MKLRRIILMLGLVAVVISARFAFAQMGRMEMVNGGGREQEGRPAAGGTARPRDGALSPERLQKELGLSEDQAQKMRRLRMEYEKETIRKHAGVRVAGLELQDLLSQKNAGLPQIEKKAQELTSLRGDLTLLRIRSLMKAKESLSDEQFAKFKQIVSARVSHRWEGMRGTAMGMHHRGMMGMGHEERGYESKEEAEHGTP